MLTGRRLLGLLFFRIALLADFAVCFGFHAALVFAIFAGGFRLFTAGFRTNRRYAAEEHKGADNGADGLHVFAFLAARLRAALVCLFDPLEAAKRLSFDVEWSNWGGL